MPESFLTTYLQYTSDSEVPTTFRRWAAISGIGILLERNIFISHGHSNIYPNIYAMLMGTAGTRKTSAINLMRRLVIQAGFTHIAAEKTSKEKFIMDLAEGDTEAMDDILETNLFGASSSSVSPMAIMADEANDFFGISNIEFLSMLGAMWDWQDSPYKNRLKTGKSVQIHKPTISILAGNTPTGFSIAFPAEILGQGFFSRLLLIYGEPNGKRIAFPRLPSETETENIIYYLKTIKSYFVGELTYTPSARKLLEQIYTTSSPLNDGRFDSYYNRRFTHLLKLCILVTASYLEKEISEIRVIEANTYLTYIESLMPKALGEFGKSKNSDVTHKILSFIESRDGCTLKDIHKVVGQDIDKLSEIGEILKKLSLSEKIQAVQGIFLPVRKLRAPGTDGTVDMSYLSEEELAVKG